MKYLKLFEPLKSTNRICKKYSIFYYTINSDGSIDVNGNVNLSYEYLTKLPIKFKNISYSFKCSNNNLTSLENSPKNVRGSFLCNNNNLTDLEGGPTHVGGNFYCGSNKLTSLEYGPSHVSGSFYCQYNNITSLEGFQTHIGVFFDCVYNPVYVIWILFKDKSKIELFNDYDIIRGTDIVLDRLNDFLITIGKKPVKSVRGYNNI